MKIRMRWMSLMISWIISGLSSRAHGDNTYQLIVPDVYVALSGDFNIRYLVPASVSLPHAFVRLLFINDITSLEITTLVLPLGRKEGQIQVTCGIVEFAGSYVARMYMHDGGPLLTETKFDVTWPSVNLVLPDRYVALTTGVKMRISSSVSCKSLLNREKFIIAVYHVRQKITDRLLLQTSTYITNTTIDDFTNDVQHEFPCNYFDVDGSYQAVLKSTFHFGSEITRSNIMAATWSDSYNLNIRSDSIFPCPNLFKIIYTRPACPSKDKIRMYMLTRRASGSLAAPLKRKYVLERRLSPDMTSLRIRCGLFNTTAAGYCFVYVSVSKHGAVEEQTQVCLAAHPNSVLPTDGEWSSWSSWGNCTSCGSSRRSRHRLCNSPSPQQGGRFCEGEAFQWQPCFKICADWIPDTPLKIVENKHNCMCGCDVTGESGEVIASGRCSGKAVWIIRTDSSHRIRFVFKYFNLYGNRQVVTVRNGDTNKSDVLYISTDNDYSQELYSTGSTLLVELFTSLSGQRVNIENITLPVYVHGFIADYHSEAISSHRSSSIVRRHMASILDSSAAIVGIALCTVIVFLAVAFVAFHKIFQNKRHKYAMAGTDSPVRSISSHGSSIVHEDVADDIEAPLTDEIKRKQLTSANGVSRKSSVTSVYSAGFKRLCTIPDIEINPKSSNKGYSPLVSPTGVAHSVDISTNENISLQGSPSLRKCVPKSPRSPILRKCTPRSPKIHPSPKIKHVSTNTSDASPSSTKHDLLTKKRQENTGVGCGIKTTSDTTDKKHQVSSVRFKNTTPTVEFHPKPKTFKTCAHPVPISGDISLTTIHIQNESMSPKPKETTTSFIQPTSQLTRPTSLSGNVSTESINKPRTEGSDNVDKLCSERDRLLPKPDGQSPTGNREEQSVSNNSNSAKSSKTGSRQTLTSPSHSAHTPSEIAVEGLELEYDDFIEDDPLSYFDYDEMQRLKWHGGEKIDKPIKEDDD